MSLIRGSDQTDDQIKGAEDEKRSREEKRRGELTKKKLVETLDGTDTFVVLNKEPKIDPIKTDRSM